MLRAGHRPLGGGCSCELACSPAYVMIRMPSVTPLKDTHVQPMNGDLGGVFKYFLFSHLFGEDEPILTHIFQRGWFNHQLVIVLRFLPW